MLNIQTPPSGQIGATILNLDAQEMGKKEAQEILEAVYKHKLVVIKNQKLEDQEYLDLAKKIGTPQIYFQENYHHKKFPEIFVSSNVLENGEKVGVPGTGQYWHTDCAFFEGPLSLTMVYPKIIPKTIRATNYIDLEAVYQKLPEHLKSFLAGKKVIHEAKWRYKIQPCDVDRSIIDVMQEFEKTAPAVQHPAVIIHPITKAKILYVSEGFSTGIADLQYEEGQKMLQEVLDFVDQKEHTHTHSWEEGDILLWDNRPLIHKASKIISGEESKSYRIGIYDEHPFYING